LYGIAMWAENCNGSDPLPFQFLSSEKSLCNQALFIDVDYDKLMINKRDVIHKTKELTEALEDVEFLPDDSVLLVRSKRYIGIGCDLKNLQKLDDALRMEPLLSQSSILCVAEVSLAYMDIESADEVIRWASKLSSG
jgi:tRNA wybutosine-synthesizing protein 4